MPQEDDVSPLSHLQAAGFLLNPQAPRQGRIRFAVMPRGARNCSDELVERSRRFALDNGLLMHTHVSAPSAPRPTVTPRSSSSGILAKPEANFRFAEVDGRILYQDRRFTALDEKKIKEESSRQLENVLHEKHGAHIHREYFIPLFDGSLADLRRQIDPQIVKQYIHAAEMRRRLLHHPLAGGF